MNVLTSRKNSSNLQKSAFLLLFHHSGPYSIRKSYFQWDLGLYNCLITRWLETMSILVVMNGVYRHQFKSIYLQNRKRSGHFFFIFGIYIQFPMFQKKKWASWVKYFWSYSLWKICLFKWIRGLLSESSFAVKLLTSLKNF